MDKERVIFRLEKNPYTGMDNYIACFPDEGANPGRIAFTAFSFVNGAPVFEPHGEMSNDYYYMNTKRVPKNTPVAERCLKAIETRYGENYRVMEKIMRG